MVPLGLTWHQVIAAAVMRDEKREEVSASTALLLARLMILLISERGERREGDTTQDKLREQQRGRVQGNRM